MYVFVYTSREMEIDKILVCRLCFEICKSGFEVIKDTTKDILNFLQLNLDLDVSNEPVACVSCMDNLKECFNFKTVCQHKIGDAPTRAENVDLTLLNASPSENVVDTSETFSGNSVCCSCEKLVNSESSVFLRNEGNRVITILEQCLPELVLNDSMCIACYRSLQNHLTFISNCMAVEDTIKEYCKAEGTDRKGQVELSTVLHFMPKSQLQGNIYDYFAVVKMEEGYEDTENGDRTKIKNEDLIIIERPGVNHIKTEDIDIKVEQDGGDRLDAFESAQQNSLLTQNSTEEVEAFKSEMGMYQSAHNDSISLHTLACKDPSKVPVYKCEMCAYQSRRKHSLLNHMLTHKYPAETLKYKCEICTYQSKRNSDLSRHVMTHRPPSEVIVYKCEICTYQSMRKSTFSVHMLIHKDPSEILMYKCESCTFQTKYKHDLSKHILTHKSNAEVTMYKCEICTYQSKRKDYLNSHMLTHKHISEVTVYSCEICVYQSKRKSAVSRHMLAHKLPSEVNFYKCKTCVFQSRYKRSLQRHIRTHTSHKGTSSDEGISLK